MKKIFLFFAALPILFFITSQPSSKEKYRIETSKDEGVIMRQTVSDQPLQQQSVIRYAIADTFVLASYTFDSPMGPDEEGWTHADLTEQTGCYFHIDDFAGLGGGDSGLLVPLQGSQSLWCGASPDSESALLCGYAALPGYGNNWDQGWCFGCIEAPDTEAIIIDYLAAWDTEPGYDYWYVEYATKSTCDSLHNIDDLGESDWIRLAAFDTYSSKTFRSDTIPAGHEGAVKIRFRFTSDDAWSDQDGLWDTDGAVIVDSLTVRSAAIVYDFEDFEDESPGDLMTADGDWECCVMPGYGDYAGLFHGTTVVQEGECVRNLSNLWGFFRGSTYDYSCGGHPEQKVVPYMNERGQFIYNEVWSPLIEWALDMYGAPVPATATKAYLAFDTYREGTRIGESLVYDVWHVRSYVDGCPTEWRDWDFIIPEYHWDWIELVNSIEPFIETNASHIQVSVGARDMCPVWCSIYGWADCHSHGPLYDNVKVYRIDIRGPRWSVRDIDLFQDNFAADGTVTGTVRIDMAGDRASGMNPSIIPGDSAVVRVREEEIGVGNHVNGVPSSGPAVYCHVKDIGPSKSGSAVSGNLMRWPVASAGGGWTVLQMDTCFTLPERQNAVPDAFCVDLNDNLYTPGDTIYFYFSARDMDNNTTYWSQPLQIYEFEAEARAGMMEMTCLPANGLNGATDILYVDDFNELGAQPYFESAFEMLSIAPDRYDVRGSSSMVGNGPGGRVVDVPAQLIPYYKKIIWNSGDLYTGSIGDGTWDKSDDFSVLYEFLDQHEDSAGVYISGDDVAADWNSMTGASAVSFRNDFMNFNLLASNHDDLGEPVNPMAVGQAGSCFEHGGRPDTLVAYGGCPWINDFDVLGTAGTSSLEMAYSNNPANGAIVAQHTTNAMGMEAGVVLSGFSFHCIRDDRAAGIADRAEHLRDILVWLNNPIGELTDADGRLPAFRNSLSQNYPNPFNPLTTIRYSIRHEGHVSLKIYNVAGQLVRTLVSDTQKPKAEGYIVTWDGTNNSGVQASSGVYFYKLVAKNFSKTKKMVLLQ